MNGRRRHSARRRAILWGLSVLCGVVSLAAQAGAQALPERERPPRAFLPQQADQRFLLQLAQIDQLILYDYHSRAFALLEDLERAGAPQDEVRRRRIRIAQAVGDHAQAAALCREALAGAPADPGLWRELAAALFAMREMDEGRAALDRYLRLVDEPRGGFAVATDLLVKAGRCQLAVALVDSARALLGDRAYLARERAVCLLALDRTQEAAREMRTDLALNPHNLQLLRRDLLAAGAPPVSEAFRREIGALAAAAEAQPEIVVLAANLALARADGFGAQGLVLPRLPGVAFAGAVLQNAGTLTREMPLLSGRAEQRAVSDYLQAVLPVLAEHQALGPRLRQRAGDHLAESCLFALQNDLLADDPQAAADQFGGRLALVQRVYPESSHLYAAQIQLARFTRDRLRDPQAAARRLEQLLQHLDLPVEGLALARLTLGECYIAARDTVRARQVLTALGRDPEFREPAGGAHFLLAKLDLAQGHFGTARDRFAAVALDNPAAPYANDALELGLLVAEELLNPTGGLDLLARYAHAVWWQLAAEPDSQRVALERFIERAARQVDMTAPQTLLEHARLELADLNRQAGRVDAALAQLERVVLELPHGRQAARALARRGEILAVARGDSAAARREYERLLVQYPDYLFAAEIRQRLRMLP